MNETHFSPDDPRLTAYALGELEPADRAVVETAIARDPALRAAVDETRRLSSQLESALLAEAVAESVPGAAASARPEEDAYRRVPARGAGRLLQFPQVYYIVGGLAAACFAVMAILRSPTPPPAPPPKMLAARAEPETVRVPIAFAPAENSAGEAVLAMSVAPTAATGAAADHATVGAEAKMASDLRDRAPALAMGRTAPALAASAGLRSGVAVTTRAAPTPPAVAQAGRAAVAKTARPAGPAENDFLRVADHPRSSLPSRVGTASYAAVRAALARGEIPPADTVRVEELVNHFSYDYTSPGAGSPDAWAAALEVAEAPWAPSHRLVRVALRGKAADALARAAEIASNLTIEVTFNARRVASYRLIGFDPVVAPAAAAAAAGGDDAGRVAAGGTLTAVFEIGPADAGERSQDSAPSASASAVADRRASGEAVVTTRLAATATNRAAYPAMDDELLRLTVRYPWPEGGGTRTQEFSLHDAGRRFEDASADFKFAAAVAEFGLILRGSAHRGTGTMGDVIAWAAAGATGSGGNGASAAARAEFLDLARRAQTLLR